MLRMYKNILSLMSLFRARPAEAGVLGWVGEHVLKESAKAFNDYVADNTVAGIRNKANNGDVEAQYMLGLIYHDGKKDEGVSQNYSEALRWFRMASNADYAPAQYSLGVMYGSGEGVPQDKVEAVKWYHKAAEQGYVDAQYNLGVAYENGEGVTQDTDEAIKWWREAARQGDEDAQEELKSIGYTW